MAYWAAGLPWAGLLLSWKGSGFLDLPDRFWGRWLSAESSLFLLLAFVVLVSPRGTFFSGRLRALGAAACVLALPMVVGEVLLSPAGTAALYAFQGERVWFLLVQSLVLVAAIRRIARPPLSGDSVRTAELVRRFRLNERETELLLLIANALTNKAIAQSQEVSEEVVKRQVSRLLKKTGTQSRSQLMGLVPAVVP